MWWPERRFAAKAALLAGLVAALGLAGCQVRPLYGSTSVEQGPLADLPAIDIEVQGGRIEQVYRNALIFGLTGGSGAATPRYKLIYRLTKRSQAIAVERGTGTPNAYQLTGGVSFLLKDIETDESRFGTSVTAVDSYTRSSQSYSNIRAERDAEDRLAKALANLTQARLAAYFATH